MENFKGLKKEQIPNIDLYMDQVTSFLERELDGFKTSEDDKLMTKTMINNYVKQKVISAPEKKKYGQKHMMQLIMIYHMKQILSMGDIKALSERIDLDGFEEVYNTFDDRLISAIDSYSQVDMNDDIVLDWLVDAYVKKKMVEKYIHSNLEND